jgi:hypothetical protein
MAPATQRYDRFIHRALTESLDATFHIQAIHVNELSCPPHSASLLVAHARVPGKFFFVEFIFIDSK